MFNGFQREDAVARAEVAAVCGASDRGAILVVQLAPARRSSSARSHDNRPPFRSATDAIRSAREDLRVQTARYRAGISTMLDVLTSEAALVQAEYSLARDAAPLSHHARRLEALIGRSL